jgi:hypothetical protein
MLGRPSFIDQSEKEKQLVPAPGSYNIEIKSSCNIAIGRDKRFKIPGSTRA